MDEMKLLSETNHSKVYRRKERVIKIPKEHFIRESIIWKILADHDHPYLLQTQISTSYAPIAFVSPRYACSLDEIMAVTTRMVQQRFLIQIGSALGFLASKAIIHRDVKPANIFCTSKDLMTTDFILGDLGSAVLLRGEGDLYTDDVTTIEYKAPDETFSFASDSWAVGVILGKMGWLDNPFMKYRFDFVDWWPAMPRELTKIVSFDSVVNRVASHISIDQKNEVKTYMQQLIKQGIPAAYAFKFALEFYSPMELKPISFDSLFGYKENANDLIRWLLVAGRPV